MSEREVTQSELIDAVNLICEYVENRLPQDWKITLEMDRYEATLCLTNPDGDDVETVTEPLISAVHTMIEYAIEHDDEYEFG